MPQYEAEVRWQRADDEAFTDRRYSRAHAWHFDGGATVPASSSPFSVPLPYSRAEHVDPEEALVAAVASCHMLTFLFLAAKRGLVVDRYVDAAAGEVGPGAGGRPAVVRITLRPDVEFSGPVLPDDILVTALHHEAHDECIIANSIRSAVTVAGSWRSVGSADGAHERRPAPATGQAPA